jgi:hypothetical protein
MAFPGYLLFFSMLFVPSAYQPVKAILGALVLGLIAINTLAQGRLALHCVVLLWTLFMVTVGSAYIFYGLLNDAPGAVRMSTVYVLWPLIFTIFVAAACNEKRLRGLLIVLVAAAIAICLYAFSFILHVVGWLPDYLYVPLEQDQGIGFYEGYMRFNLFSISSLFFVVPFVMAALMTWPRERAMPIPRVWLWITLALGMLIVLLCGRRVLLIVVALAPAITLCLQQFLPSSMKWMRTKMGVRALFPTGIILAGLVTYLNVSSGFDVWAMLVNRFAVGWDFTAEQSALERREQFFPLLEGWFENPLFGAGHGSTPVGYFRSYEMPWAYELSYLALLFHTGMLGFLAYTAGIAWIFWMGLRIIRLGNHLSLYMLPVLVGCSGFLIGNATNPYLEKYDYIWVIFLPVALINFHLLNGERKLS